MGLFWLEVSRGVKGTIRPGNLDYIAESAQYLKKHNISEAAAYILAYVAKGHPFTDANKRTAYFATRYFLMRNGADFNGTSPEEASREMENIAKQPDMKSALKLAKRLTDKYNIIPAPPIQDYDTFYMSKIYNHSMSDGCNSNVVTNCSIFSSMLKNHLSIAGIIN